MNKKQLKDLNIFFSLLSIGTAWSYFLSRRRPILFAGLCVGVLGTAITQERLNVCEYFYLI